MQTGLNEVHRNPLWWLAAKTSLMFFWLSAVLLKLFQGGELLYPTGIFSFLSGHFMSLYPVKGLIVILLILFCVLYLLEKQMHITTTALSVLSVLIITYQESNGIYARAAPYSLAFIGQSIAYFQGKGVAENRVLYPVQLIAAAYTLAGIAKLIDSGHAWFTDGSFFALQILKNYSYLYADSADLVYLNKGNQISSWLTSHPVFNSVILAIALILELFCLVALVSGSVRFLWGLGLFGMHIGIAVLMGIGFSSIFFPMLIFFINPIYWLITAIIEATKTLSRFVRRV
jgi:hypothetical protein